MNSFVCQLFGTAKTSLVSPYTSSSYAGRVLTLAVYLSPKDITFPFIFCLSHLCLDPELYDRKSRTKDVFETVFDNALTDISKLNSG